MTDTAFGPADHPDLPLGLRRHPRWALRYALQGFDGLELHSIYAHERWSLDQLRNGIIPADDKYFQLERWDDDTKKWIEA